MRIHTTVDVDLDEVIDEISDKDLLDVVRNRNLTRKIEFEGARLDDLVRALDHQDWREVDYLLRTYFLADVLRGPNPLTRAPRFPAKAATQ